MSDTPAKKPKLEAPASPISLTLMAERKPHPSEGNPKYKTEYCSSYQRKGTCRWGDKCKFAHGETDLRSLIHEHSHESPLLWDMPRGFKLLQELVMELIMVSAAPLAAADAADDDADEAVRAFGPDALVDAVTALLGTTEGQNLNGAVEVVLKGSSAPTPELKPFVAAVSKVAILMRNGPPGWEAPSDSFVLQAKAAEYAEHLFEEAGQLVEQCVRYDGAQYGAFMQLLQATKSRPLLDDESIWSDKARISMQMVEEFYVERKK